MKKFILYTIFIFINYSLFSQLKISEKAKITWGEEIKFKKGAEFSEYIGKDDDSHYLIKSLKRGMQYEINVFGYDMKLKSKKVINMKAHQNYKMSYEGSYFLNDNIYIFSSFPDKKTKTNKLYCRVFDKNTLSSGELKEIEQLPYEKRKFKGGFGVVSSEDNKKLLIYLGKPYEKNSHEKFGFTILNTNLDVEWKKEVELPYTEQLFSVQDYKITNNGDVYILGKEYKEEKSKRNKHKPNYKYHIIAYLNKGNSIKDYEINLNDKFITDIAYNIAENGDLVCSGLYSETGTYSIKGAFFLAIDSETKNIKNNNLKKFDEDFITQGWTDKAIAKAKKKKIKKDKSIEMYEYDLKDFILREDGGAVLIAEQFFVRIVTRTYTDSQGNMRTTNDYHYYYKDIIVININNEGQIEWATKIDKYQHSVNDGGYYSSYVLQIDEDKLHIIYNERARKYFEKEERKQLNRKDKNASLTIITTVQSNGDHSKEILINVSNENTYPVPKFSEQINDKQLLMYTRKMKKRKFALVNFD